MKKHFNITKSTSLCQRLVAEYCNIETNTEEEIIQQKELFNKIKYILLPQAQILLAIKSFDIGKSNKDISMIEFDNFITDSLIYYLDNYNPLHSENRYNQPANFDTYYFACLKSSMYIFFNGDTVSSYFQKLAIQKDIEHKERERIYEEYINRIRLESRSIVKLQNNASRKLIQTYVSISNAEQTEFGMCNINFVINVKKACDGEAKTACGYKWMYEDDYKLQGDK